VRWVVSLVFGGNGGNNAVVFWLGSLTWQEKIRLIPFVWVDFNLLDLDQRSSHQSTITSISHQVLYFRLNYFELYYMRN
jgi:hypothetical protein